MLYRLRQRSKDEGGFTLIELLVVILIIGILAAIAIPAFLNQKSKATDASAKTQARTAETAMETYSTDHNGSYEGASLGEAPDDRADTDRHNERRSGGTDGRDQQRLHGHLDLEVRCYVLDRTYRRRRDHPHLYSPKRKPTVGAVSPGNTW